MTIAAKWAPARGAFEKKILQIKPQVIQAVINGNGKKPILMGWKGFGLSGPFAEVPGSRVYLRFRKCSSMQERDAMGKDCESEHKSGWAKSRSRQLFRSLFASFAMMTAATAAPTIVTQPASQSVATGQTVTFNVSATATPSSPNPLKRMMFYYGWLNSFNSATNSWVNENVAQDLKDYDILVLGNGLQDPTHGDFANTQTIIARLKVLNPAIQIFGYVTKAQAIATFQTKATQWNSLGVQGIFMDESGYGYGASTSSNTRAAFNTRVNYVHGLSSAKIVFANSWNPNHILGTVNDASYPNTTYNSGLVASTLAATDWFLIESHVVNTDAYTTNTGWNDQTSFISRTNEAASLSNQYGLKVASVNIVNAGNANALAMAQAAETGALAGNFDACGVSDAAYGASSAKGPKYTRVNLAGLGTWALAPTVVINSPWAQGASDTYYFRVNFTGKTSQITATGTALTYQWRKAGSNIPGATAVSYTTPATVASDNGTQFTVVVSDGGGSTTSAIATLTVGSGAVAPSITVQPAAATVTVGQTASFSVTATGTAPITYQWRKNGAALVGATTFSYTTQATVTGDNGAQYSVVVSNSAGTITSSTALLTVSNAPSIVTQPANQTIAVGQSATFSVTAAGNGTPSSPNPLKRMMFYYGWLNSFNSPSNGWVNENVAQDLKDYDILVLGNGIQDPTHLDFPNTQIILARVKALNPAIQIFGYVTKAQTLANFQTKANQWNSLGVYGIFMDESGYGYGASTASNTRAAFNARVNYVHGLGSAKVVFANSWNQNHILGTINDPSYPNTTYNSGLVASTLASTDWFLIESHVINTDAFTGNGGWNDRATYISRTNEAASLSNQYGLNVASLNIVNAGNSSALAMAQAAETGALAGNFDACGVSDAFYGASSGLGPKYTRVNLAGLGSWAPAPTVVINEPWAQGASDAYFFRLDFTARTSQVTATGTSLTYQWRKNGAIIPGATAASYSTPAASASDNGAQYSVVVSNSTASVVSNNALLTVNSSSVPPSIGTPPSNQTVLTGQTATFFVTASGTAPLSYQWRRDRTNIPGATGSSYTTPATMASDNGALFSVVISNPISSVTSADASLTVNPVLAAPTIVSQPTSQSVAVGQSATFSVVASGTGTGSSANPLKRMMFYYGWLSGFNSPTNNFSNESVAQDLKDYDILVVGDGVQNPAHGDFANSQVILSRVKALNPKILIFGYVTKAQILADFQTKATLWNNLGVNGIFMDEAGYDYGAATASNTRAAFNTRVNYVHGLSSAKVVFANSWNQNHILGTINDVSFPNTTYNPGSTASTLASTDWFLIESHVINTDAFTGNAGWNDRATFIARTNEAASLSNQYGLKVASLNIVNAGNTTALAMAQAAETGALAGNFDACGVSDSFYGAGSGLGPKYTRVNLAGLGSWAASPTVVVNEPWAQGASDAYYFRVNFTARSSQISATGAATGTALAYQWRRNGLDINGATTASYTTPATVASDNGTQFSVVASNSAGSATSDIAVLSVIAAAPTRISELQFYEMNNGTVPSFKLGWDNTTDNKHIFIERGGIELLRLKDDYVSIPTTLNFGPMGAIGFKWAMDVNTGVETLILGTGNGDTPAFNAMQVNRTPEGIEALYFPRGFKFPQEDVPDASQPTCIWSADGRDAVTGSIFNRSMYCLENNTTESGGLSASRVSFDQEFGRTDVGKEFLSSTKSYLEAGELKISNTYTSADYHPPVAETVVNAYGVVTGSVNAENVYGGNVYGNSLVTAPRVETNTLVAKTMVTTPQWQIATDLPDYVFAADYKLPSLEETEAYTKAHKHLPLMPSAKEMSEKGMDVTKMNLQLLRTVEELTLHVVALQKELKSQKREMQNQKNEMKKIRNGQQNAPIGKAVVK
jgi:hypothetical protein